MSRPVCRSSGVVDHQIAIEETVVQGLLQRVEYECASTPKLPQFMNRQIPAVAGD